jgi:Uma2 family endonuclease
MSVVLKPRYTPEQYLDIERAADYKSEYFDGEIFAMAGASEEHNTITFNLSGALVPQLRGTGCRGYAGDMRVKVDASGLYTYPDVVVVCGERHFTDDHLDTLTNPTLIVEVLSPSTEGYDRGQKFANYRRIPSLETYVLVAQDRAHIEKFERRPDGQWLLSRRAIWPAICRSRPSAARSSLPKSTTTFRSRRPPRRRTERRTPLGAGNFARRYGGNAPRATCASGPGANGCGRPVRE